ncbi:DUF6443 domain-containing protein [Flagellimonas sp. 2504JD4-2]
MITKKYQNNIRYSLFLGIILMFFSTTTWSQQVLGPSPVERGDEEGYTLSSAASNVTWSVPAAATIIGSNTGSTVVIRWDRAGTYFVRADYSGTPGFDVFNVTVTLQSPATPTIDSASCGEATLTVDHNDSLKPRATGVSWFWQGTNSNGTDSSASVNATQPYKATEIGSHYIRARDDQSGEWSASSSSVYVASIPPVTGTPNASAPAVCDSSNAVLSASGISGATYNWYNASDSPIGTGANYTVTNPVDGTAYRVSATVNGCEGEKRTVTVTVNDTPPLWVPLEPVENQCSTPNSVALTARSSGISPSDSNIQHIWYTSEFGSGTTTHSVVNGGASYTTEKTVTQNATYWVSAIRNGCETARQQVTATFTSNTTPVLGFIDNNGALCEPASFTLYATGGTSESVYEWYDVSTGGTALHEGSNFNPPAVNYNETNNGIKTYYLGGTLKNALGCDFPMQRIPVPVTVKPLPPPPTLNLISQPSCSDPNGAFVITNYSNTYNYVVSPPTGVTISNDTITAPPNTYTVTATLNDCTSGASSQMVIDPQPSALGTPTLSVVTDPTCSNTNGTFSITNYDDSYTYSVNPSTGVTIAGSLITAPEGDYTVTASSGSCTSVASESRTISAQPTTPDVPVLGTVTQPTCASPMGTFSITNYNALYTYAVEPSAGVNILNGTITAPTGNYTVTATQNGCTSPVSLSAVVDPLQGDCLSSDPQDHNYVYSRTYQQESQSVIDAQFFTQNDALVQQIAFFDGLGRPFQQVGIAQSPNTAKDDIVTHIAYDNFGRLKKEWLPYTDIDPLAALGSFRTTAEADTDTHYVQHYGQDILSNAPNPFSEKEFEASPINRVLKQGAPGNDWALGNGHEIEFGYVTNTSADGIKQYQVSLNHTGNTHVPTLLVSPDNNGEYGEGELYKNITYDENHDGTTSKLHTTEEFTNKQGRVVLKRTYAEVGSPSVVEAHDTYYVYDDYGNLTYVLSPKMDASSATLANINANMDELGYQYVYDHRNRLVEKKIPGKGWEHIVYNKLDQPVMTRDSIQRAAGEWLFTKYDAFGRVAYTGKATSVVGTARTTVQDEVDGLSGNLWVSQGSQTNFGGTDIFYDNGAYPTQSTTEAQLSEILTVNYYDGYSFVPGTWPTVPTSVFTENIDTDVRSLATGTRVKVLDQTPAQWITTATYYDDKGRPIYTYSENEYLETVDIVESELDFVARPTRVRSTHTRTLSGVEGTIVTLDNFEYDHVGRLLKQTQCVGDETLGGTCDAASTVNLVLQNTTVTTDQAAQNSITVEPVTEITNGELEVTGNGGQEELIADNEYDNLGQLIKKNVGNTVASPLQEVDYTYNVRGWLKSINEDANNDNDLFNFGINYNTVAHGGTALFNGNIAETEWETANDNIQRWYHYGYDALNRITDATSYNGDYNVSNITYDRNDNIGNLQRQGAAGVIDNLTYNYHNTEISNRLRTVADASGSAEGFTDGTNSGDDYAYDANGNMTMDLNKGIQADGITYNHLNLPTSVTLPGGTISYIYDAVGTKLKKTAEGSVTEYAGNYVYSGNTTSTTLQFFDQPEGYVTPSAVEGSYNYVYQYKDHLGNIRLSFSDGNGDGDIDVTNDPLTTEIVEENNYYPFGLKHKGYNDAVSELGNSVANRWKYQQQELNESLDYNMYEFELRHYDAAIGRFVTTDPYEQFDSPYLAMGNNPVVSFDPDGGYCYDANGNQIACPEDELYDDYRDNEENHINVLDEVVVEGEKSEQTKANEAYWKEINENALILDKLATLKTGKTSQGRAEEAKAEAEQLSIIAYEIPTPSYHSPFEYINGAGAGVKLAMGVKALISARRLVKLLKLPITGKIRFIPRKVDILNGKILKKNGGYVDKFGNVWKKGPSRTAGEAFEWDVQLSAKGKAQLGHLSRDGKHLNVSLKGKITH